VAWHISSAILPIFAWITLEGISARAIRRINPPLLPVAAHMFEVRGISESKTVNAGHLSGITAASSGLH
jgi:hypothetical protein